MNGFGVWGRDWRLLDRCRSIGSGYLFLGSVWLNTSTSPPPLQEISEKMLRRTPVSLNAISHDCAMELVSTALKDGVQVTKVYVDTVGDPEQYQKKLYAAFDSKVSRRLCVACVPTTKST